MKNKLLHKKIKANYQTDQQYEKTK